MCEHIYDRIGVRPALVDLRNVLADDLSFPQCAYNAPAAYVEGTFETCLGDEQLFPGVYVGDNGVTSTYTQPEGLITTCVVSCHELVDVSLTLVRNQDPLRRLHPRQLSVHPVCLG